MIRSGSPLPVRSAVATSYAPAVGSSTRSPVRPRAAPVDVGVQLGSDAVLGVDDDQVQVSVAVEVDGAAHPAAVVGELTPAPLPTGSTWLAVDPGRPALVVAVRIGEHQVDVAVAVRVGAVDPLDGAGRGHVEVVAAVVELASPEGVEASMDPPGRVVSHCSSVSGRCRSMPTEPSTGTPTVDQRPLTRLLRRTAGSRLSR